MSRSAGRGRTGGAKPGDDLQPYLRSLFDVVGVGVCFLDGRGRVVAANAAMARLFAPKTFPVGRPCDADGCGPESLCGRCLAAGVLESGRQASLVAAIPIPGGGVRHVETKCLPLRDAAGGLLGVAEIARDVTRRLHAEREMAMVTQDIEMLLGSIRSILVSLDGTNRVRRFNASAEAVLGLAAGAVVGRDFFALDLDWDGDAVRRAVEESRRSLAPVRVDEVRCRLPDDDERLLGLTVNPVPSTQGAPAGVLILGQDLSDIKARELKVLHERRMQAIGRLASGIAHEINTPIQYVSYNAGFLDEAFDDLLSLLGAHTALADAVAADPDAATDPALARVRELEEAVDIDYLRQEIPSAIANTRKGIRQVSEIVAAMRQLSHPGTSDPLFFDLNAAVRDIVTVTRNAWKHVAEVQLDLAPDVPLVYGQPHEVSQVLLNVVLNAAQAVEERFADNPLTRGRIVIATGTGAGCAEVTVADNGPGVDPEIAGRIFDPFFTTKAAGKGTGQGLAISQAIMARHGGSIDFSGRPGEGAVFSIRFPLEEATGERD